MHYHHYIDFVQFNFLFPPEEIERFFNKNESEKIIYFNSILLFIWEQNIQILQNCPALFAQLFIQGFKGVHGAHYRNSAQGPFQKPCYVTALPLSSLNSHVMLSSRLKLL